MLLENSFIHTTLGQCDFKSQLWPISASASAPYKESSNINQPRVVLNLISSQYFQIYALPLYSTKSLIISPLAQLRCTWHLLTVADPLAWPLQNRHLDPTNPDLISHHSSSPWLMPGPRTWCYRRSPLSPHTNQPSTLLWVVLTFLLSSSSSGCTTLFSPCGNSLLVPPLSHTEERPRSSSEDPSSSSPLWELPPVCSLPLNRPPALIGHRKDPLGHYPRSTLDRTQLVLRPSPRPIPAYSPKNEP